MPFIVVIALLFSVSSYAQSDETCVAYMEADAAYEAAVNKNEDVVNSSWASISATNSLLLSIEEGQSLRIAAIEAQANRLDPQRFDKASRLREKALEKVNRASEAAGKARKEYEKFLAAARAKFDPIRDAAYRAAYGGPTSNVYSVMNRLIAADRERCRVRLER